MSPVKAASPATDPASLQRKEIAARYLVGNGIEVGAGNRPFPLQETVRVSYGDIRDLASVERYFDSRDVKVGSSIDAQTFAGIETDSLDFVISAHVIEHLWDPIGSIVNAIRVLRAGGVHLLAVPDLRHTFDRLRPETTVEHSLRDYADGGSSTCQQAYEEHLRYVHPELTGEHYPDAEIERQAIENVKRWPEFDIHFHAWTREAFEALLAAAQSYSPFVVEETVSAGNENIFVLRKTAGVAPKV
ncbi:hypothetical protein BH18VER1_BH18VER1_18210 [soil metagenome]